MNFKSITFFVLFILSFALQAQLKMVSVLGDSMVLQRSSMVKILVAVRYAFSNYTKTDGYLYNTTGLPVPTFRTDNW